MNPRTKKHLIFFSFLVFGLLLPIYFVGAAFSLADLPLKIATAIGGWVIQMFIYLGYLIYKVAGIILDWVISPSFISFKFTTNEFVRAGWTLCRDLANMGFIIVLAVIGLATALRIKEYEVRKTLPWLIIIALLINFTPVICGLVIDASNIIMNFFLSEVSGSRAYQYLLDLQYNKLSHLFESHAHLAPGEAVGFLVQSLTMAGFFWGTALIFFILAAFFIIRYVVLWVLVILSPLAFFCYILPATRKVFAQWWQQFLQWSIIGAIMAFFLYLAEQMLVIITKSPKSLIGNVPPQQIMETSPAGFFDQTLPYLIPLILMAIGFSFALASAPAGASGIIKAVTKGEKAVARWRRKRAKGAKERAKELREMEKEETIRKRLERTPVIGGIIGGPRAFARASERRKRKEMKELGKDFEALPPEAIERALSVRPSTRRERLRQARLFEILEEKGEISDEAIKKHLPMAQRMKLDIDKILERRPDAAPMVDKKVRQVMAKIDPETFRKRVQTEALYKPEVALNVLLDEMKFNEIDKLGTPAQREAITDSILKPLPPDIQASLTEEEKSILHKRNKYVFGNPNWIKIIIPH